MARSYNGQLVGAASVLGIKTYTVPGTQVRVALRPFAAPVLLWIGSQIDKRVANIDVTAGHREPDDWGYAYRNTRGQNTWSNHASGTAVDYNATSWPRGVRRMNARQVAECRRIRDEANRAGGMRLVDWGGDYVRAPVDQMHWELASGVTAADVARAMRALATKPAPKRAATKAATVKKAASAVVQVPPATLTALADGGDMFQPMFVRVKGKSAVYVVTLAGTRHVKNQTEKRFLEQGGVTRTVEVTATELAQLLEKE
jgi:hypothetical protein